MDSNQFAWWFARVVLAPLGLLASAGCASLPPPVDKPPVRAFSEPQATPLGRQVAAAAPGPSVSGFRMLLAGEDAFGALAVLVDRAQRSLDLQYYIVRDEESSRVLLRRVFAAAERGVRVRVLVDDLNTSGEEDLLLCLERHANIEVRLYNPFPMGRFSTISRVVASATDAARISARMHNKMLVADNALAVTGGRNLGDAYFVQSKESNFLDLDLLVAGPVVRKLSASFDSFWNNDLAYPIGSLVKREPKCSGPEPVHAGEAAAAAPVAAAPAPVGTLTQELLRNELKLVWAPATLLADKPSKITSEGQPSDAETVSDDIEELLRSARREVIIVSPYFVPGEQGMALARELKRRGVKLRVLTNSLAATDAPAVHIGYARYRPELLKLGVELFELRPQLGTLRSKVGSFGSSQASLHAKALVIDRSVVLVGSMNMDPRSANLNSEIGLVLRSAPLAEQLVKLYDDVSQRSSYRVVLGSNGGKGRLQWIDDHDPAKGPVTFERDPQAGVGLRLLLWLLTPIAPEEML